MSLIIKIELPPETQQWINELPQFQTRFLAGIAREMDRQNQLTIGDITIKKLSFPREGPAVPDGLRVQTGLLRRSIRATKAIVVGGVVASAIGSNVKYAAIHEFGGQTKPHIIKAKKGKALAFSIGGRKILATQVKHPGSKMPARRYVSSTVEARAGNYTEAFGNVAVNVFNSLGKNNPPQIT